MVDHPVYVGIDVAKATLDVAVAPPAERWTLAYTEREMAGLVTRLTALAPALVVLEATGGLEGPLVGALAAAGLPVVVVNPRQVRDVAKATGTLAKTDALDAAVLAHFAATVRPTPRPLPDAATQSLAALVTRRRQLVEMLTAERNRLGSAPRTLRGEIQAHITWLKRRLARLDTDLGQAIRTSPAWRVQDDLLRSGPGVGSGYGGHPPRQPAGAGPPRPEGDRRPGRRGAAQPGQWHAPGPPPGLGRPGGRPGRPVHGDAGGGPP